MGTPGGGKANSHYFGQFSWTQHIHLVATDLLWPIVPSVRAATPVSPSSASTPMRKGANFASALAECTVSTSARGQGRKGRGQGLCQGAET